MWTLSLIYKHIHSYLSADYERGVFNVSACSWNEDTEENIVTIISKDTDSSGCSGGECSSSDGSSGAASGLSRGAVAGIAVAAVVGLVLLLAFVFFCIRRQRQKSAYRANSPEPDVSVLSGPIHNGGPPEPSSCTEESLPQATPWSPDALHGSSGVNTGQNNGSSGESGHLESSPGEHGLELDGQDTQIKPVYHELPGSRVRENQ